MDQQAKERMRAAGLRLAEIEKARAKMAADARETATKLKKEQADNHFKRTMGEALKEVEEKAAKTQRKRLIRNSAIATTVIATMGGLAYWREKEDRKMSEGTVLADKRDNTKSDSRWSVPLPRFSFRV